VNDDGMINRIPTLVLAAGLDHSVAAGAVEAGARGRNPGRSPCLRPSRR
jgi:hypothetical protein